MATSATAVNITQNTPRAVIDWRSFSIGNGNTINVNNGTGATLSRVTGIDRSVIDGKLAASGSFYLINPQGVVVGPSGVVTTGGRFVASTLDIGNNNFMNGGPLNLTGSGDGVVVNLGKISSTGGDVFLVSRKLVENEGSISAPKGSAELATGSEVLLKDSATGPQVFVQAGTHGDVVNKGTIEAAQIDLRAADGNIFALAGQHDDLRATGTATREGKVWLVADRGTAHVHSKIEASNADGTGGTVITTGNTLHLDDAAIDAASWDISAPEFNAGPLNSATLARNLSAGTSITGKRDGRHGRQRQHQPRRGRAMDGRCVAHAERGARRDARPAGDAREHRRGQPDAACRFARQRQRRQHPERRHARLVARTRHHLRVLRHERHLHARYSAAERVVETGAV
ncbi:filamentous hemagglutinin N-terminal domain-containing protein [Caballeronia sp. LZ031]|uniref:two-partner secretion domain-containing protein n=1 Tax=Caballeronia sp. LZ031 TaxID=3038556 RepID=UPI0028591DD8|nr:filamentous hemagglutinin N-terminal domain-containing protein [Caballeronia sp. LZ031]MDR5841455.1 filamentous hemagglutinin N-terminal domain-containing protein [Caballeronia sp. LZ031]